MARILVVDDEPDSRFLLRLIFETAGHEVQEARDGQGALISVATYRPALIVTDMMMPLMGGPELIRRLRADPLTADIPILCLSGNPDLAVGADAALDKYGDPDDLMPAVERLLDEGHGSR